MKHDEHKRRDFASLNAELLASLIESHNEFRLLFKGIPSMSFPSDLFESESDLTKPNPEVLSEIENELAELLGRLIARQWIQAGGKIHPKRSRRSGLRCPKHIDNTVIN